MSTESNSRWNGPKFIPIDLTQPDSGGLRFNEGKLRLDLVPPSLERAVAEILTWAIVREQNPYPERNWERGMPWSKVVSSLQRHLNALRSGQWLDSESGKPHTWHIACNIAFLIEYEHTCPHLNDICPTLTMPPAKS